jgi:hypothetical protein
MSLFFCIKILTKSKKIKSKKYCTLSLPKRIIDFKIADLLFGFQKSHQFLGLMIERLSQQVGRKFHFQDGQRDLLSNGIVTCVFYAKAEIFATNLGFLHF